MREDKRDGEAQRLFDWLYAFAIVNEKQQPMYGAHVSYREINTGMIFYIYLCDGSMASVQKEMRQEPFSTKCGPVETLEFEYEYYYSNSHFGFEKAPTARQVLRLFSE